MQQSTETCPIEFSDHLGREFQASSKNEQRAELGQYFTPTEVADFMASLLKPISKPYIRILDPGAGSGVLTSAAIKALVQNSQSKSSSYHVDLFEIDPSLMRQLRSSMTHLKTWCENRGKSFSFEVHTEDFVLARSSALGHQPSLLQSSVKYDLVVSNPPYFKISKDDPRAMACTDIVYGQPNIYALFMAISAALLDECGQFLFITPRSFASGQYFKAFRKFFFSQIALTRIHQFVSRAEAFERDSVLQENIITYGVKGKHSAEAQITISSSKGKTDLGNPATISVAKKDVLDIENDYSLTLPSNHQDLVVLEMVRGWKNSLEKMGLKISTGPIVPFRSTEFLCKDKIDKTVPLYWIQHIKPMQTVFPIEGFRKQQWFKNVSTSKKLLVKNQNMILMRRFSPKEDLRRLTVSPFFMDDYEGELIGLENHLNYIYRPNKNFSVAEVVGLSAFLSSKVFDMYFRIFNGNTQVSATELRSAPLPSSEQLIEIGSLLQESRLFTHQSIDSVVDEIIGLETLA